MMAYVVDTSAHVISENSNRYPFAPRLNGKLPAWSRGREHWTAEELLESMRESGVHQAALVHQTAVYDGDQSYCLDTVKKYPESFVAIGAIEPITRHSLSTMNWLVEQPGIGAIRIEHAEEFDASQWLELPQTMPLWEAAAASGIPLSLPFVTIKHAAMLRRMLERYPTVSVILRRMAGAPTEDGPPYAAAQDLFDLAEFPGVYLVFSRENIRAARKGKSTPEAFFEAFINKFGANRIMWASFFITNVATGDEQYKDVIDEVRQGLSFLSQQDRDWLMGETARRVFPALRRAAA